VLPFCGKIKNTSEVNNVANKYAARKMFDKAVAAYIKKDFKKSVDLRMTPP
jgi:hypothetical protein